MMTDTQSIQVEASRNPPPKRAEPLWMRRVRLVRRLGYGVVLLLIGWYVVKFTSIKPAVSEWDAADAQVLQSTVDELVVLAGQLPQSDLKLYESSGQWLGSRSSIRMEFQWPWNPEPNSVHAACIPYSRREDVQLVIAQTSRALDFIKRECATGLTFRDPISPLVLVDTEVSGLQAICSALRIAARVSLDEEQNPDQAAEQLLMALDISHLLDQSAAWRDYSSQLSYEVDPLEELTHVLRKPGISRETADRVAAALEDDLSLPKAMDDYAGLTDNLDHLLNRCYVSEEDGGYLVVNQALQILRDRYVYQQIRSDTNMPNQPRLARVIANLGAPLFYSRTQVRHRLDRLREAVRELAEHPAKALEEQAKNYWLPDTRWAFYRSTASGVYDCVAQWITVDSIRSIRGVVMRRRAVYVMARLAAFRAENGAYPATLEELAAFEGRELPLDLNTNQPFLYEPKQTDSFTLDSVDRIQVQLQNNGQIPNYNVQYSRSYLKPRGGGQEP
jgi:hypothetical protein